MTIETEIIAFASSQPLDIPEGLSAALPTSIVWMPAGQHAISANTFDGAGYRGNVICDEQAARAVAASYDKSLASGQRIWIDFNHDDGEAAAWVKGFSWDASRGIIASVEWTAKGAEALRGKSFYSFSPAFACERESGRIGGLLSKHAAGGLVNKPAFTAMPALIAASAAPNLLPTAADGLSATAENLTKMDTVTAPAAASAAAPVIETSAPVQASAAPSVADFKAMIDGLNARIDALKAVAPVAPVVASAAPLPQPMLLSPGVSAESRGNVSVKLGPLEAVLAMSKESNAVKRGRIFCNELRDFTSKPGVFEVLAANSFGSLTSDLIVLKALDLLKLNFPTLKAVTTDFTAESVKYGQNIQTRIITVPTVTSYNTTTGYAVSNAATSDVTVVINKHNSLTISVNANEASGTGRDLFGEQVEVMQYALGKDLVDSLYALFIIGTYTNATTVATASITRTTLPVALAQAFNTRGVPQMKRSLLLNAAAFAALAVDPTVVQLATYQEPNIIKEYTLPKLSGFQPIEAINLPGTGNMTGFAFTPDAAIIATRLPMDYTQALPGSSYGSVSTITNPDTGISVLKTDFVDHKLGSANSRIAWMYGVAAGQVASGQIVKSA